MLKAKKKAQVLSEKSATELNLIVTYKNSLRWLWEYPVRSGNYLLSSHLSAVDNFLAFLATTSLTCSLPEPLPMGPEASFQLSPGTVWTTLEVCLPPACSKLLFGFPGLTQDTANLLHCFTWCSPDCWWDLSLSQPWSLVRLKCYGMA